MPHFFIKQENISGDICVIEGDDYHHLARVRRIRPGSRILLNDDTGRKIHAEILGVSGGRVEARIVAVENGTGSRPGITLYASILKGKNFETALRKAVELGVSGIVPVISGRCVPDTSGREKGKEERWKRIASEAAKQSMRNSVPVIGKITGFREAVENCRGGGGIIAHPGAQEGLRECLARCRGAEVSLFTGPEGGFSGSEIDFAAANDIRPANFGFTCLRAETAVVALTAILVYEWCGE